MFVLVPCQKSADRYATTPRLDPKQSEKLLCSILRDKVSMRVILGSEIVQHTTLFNVIKIGSTALDHIPIMGKLTDKIYLLLFLFGLFSL